MEATAIGLLKRAIVEDTGGRFTQALVCYQEGIQLLMDVRKGIHNTVFHLGIFLRALRPALKDVLCLRMTYLGHFLL